MKCSGCEARRQKMLAWIRAARDRRKQQQSPKPEPKK